MVPSQIRKPFDVLKDVVVDRIWKFDVGPAASPPPGMPGMPETDNQHSPSDQCDPPAGFFQFPVIATKNCTNDSPDERNVFHSTVCCGHVRRAKKHYSLELCSECTH